MKKIFIFKQPQLYLEIKVVFSSQGVTFNLFVNSQVSGKRKINYLLHSIDNRVVRQEELREYYLTVKKKILLQGKSRLCINDQY